MNNFVSGMIAALPLCAIGAVYAMLRYDAFSAIFRDGDPTMADMSAAAMRLMLLAMFGLGPLLFGGIAGLVYGVLGSRQSYLGLALGLAVLMSAWAAVSRTPMMPDKIVMNFAVALVLGILVPNLVGA